MPNETELLTIPLAEQARLVREGEIAPRAIVEAALDAIAERDGELHAFLAVDRAAEGGVDGPLAGVALGVKDLLSTAGMTTTFGSRVFASHVPDTDAPVVARLRAAGAAIIGKTNTPEFGLGAETRTEIAPAANNPWDTSRTTGGSSGGSASAAVARLCSATIGSDAGGSIRLPAAWCGAVGIKPTYGRVPAEVRSVGSDHPTETVGPMTRTVEDAALLLQVMSGFHPADPTSARMPVPDLVAAATSPGESLRVRWGLDLGMGPCDPGVAAAVTAACRELAAASVDVERSELDVGEPHPFFCMWELLAGAAVGRQGPVERDHRDALADYTVEFIDAGRELTVARYLQSVHRAKQLRVLLDTELEACDAVLVPSTAVSAWPHGQPPSEVDGRPLATQGVLAYGGLPYLALASVTGHPVVSVPVGFDDQGLPVGVQLIGKHWDEATLLQVAARLERAVGIVTLPG